MYLFSDGKFGRSGTIRCSYASDTHIFGIYLKLMIQRTCQIPSLVSESAQKKFQSHLNAKIHFFFFFFRRHEKIPTNPQILLPRKNKNGFCIQMSLKYFLRTFRHQGRYRTCSLDPKLQVDINYIHVGWIGVAYRPTSPASAESKKSLIFRICGFVGIFSCLRQKSEFFSSKWL